METKELLKKKKQALAALEKYNLLKSEVEAQCHHPGEYLVAKERYYEGDYYNKAYTEFYNQCTICLKCSESTRRTHSYYG